MTTIWRSMILQPRMMISLQMLCHRYQYLRCGGQDIWAHADYIRMFEFADKFYAEYVSNPQAPCLVITGQPGAGELSDVVIMLVLLTSHILPLGRSLWRWFALQKCCAQKSRSSSVRITSVGCSLKKDFLSNPLPARHETLFGHLSTRWILLRAHPQG